MHPQMRRRVIHNRVTSFVPQGADSGPASLRESTFPPMPLSHAIQLGSTLVKPGLVTRIRSHSKPSVGCPIVMACLAVGKEVSYVTAMQAWPWTRKPPSAIPCSCDIASPNYLTLVAHLWDTHVYRLKDWTLDELNKWVASVEPANAQRTQ